MIAETIKTTKAPRPLTVSCAGHDLTRMPSLDVIEGFDQKSDFVVTELNCSENKLHFIDNLPPTIIELRCSFNLLISLPDFGRSANLKIIECRDNRLRYLPRLPPALQILDCGNNYLAKIGPAVPTTLEILIVDNNQLAELPNLSRTKIKFLDCRNNHLERLPQLPLEIKRIKSEGNLRGENLTREIPSLQYLVLDSLSSDRFAKIKAHDLLDLVNDMKYCGLCDHRCITYRLQETRSGCNSFRQILTCWRCSNKPKPADLSLRRVRSCA
jgi:Leucine-rich repeat (LRR) protein